MEYKDKMREEKDGAWGRQAHSPRTFYLLRYGFQGHSKHLAFHISLVGYFFSVLLFGMGTYMTFSASTRL